MSSDSTKLMGKRVAVVVLNWNGVEWLKTFMGNWEALTPEWAELVIVDNGSTDGSLAYLDEYYPHIRRLDFGENYGFAEGYNRAIQALDYPVVVLLNSDAALHEDWLRQPMELLDAYPDVVAIQPKIHAQRERGRFEYAGAAGGYVDILGYPYCAGRLFDTLEWDKNQYDSVRPLMWATGACLIVRREAYLSAGGLDARFFAHQEEIDLCWRMRARGGRILFAPESRVYHVGGGTLDATNPKKTYLNFRNNLLMLYKNMSTLRFVVTLGIRFVLDVVALLQFVCKGRSAQAVAVLRAWRDALLLLPRFAKAHRENRQKATVSTDAILSPISIVWQYYAMGRKTFSQLKNHHGETI